ncbi:MULTISPECIES: helix-turn-helix transcriptional regulator [Streptomyces]|uniref:helix-turn-helix transcriptional regulator n=1 Tax=Streptomyces TaxID=1883 RepID=UPI000CD533BE|nr:MULTISPECIES: helix-turn-helix transcriptional regulator [Streptomyces]
MFQMSQGEPIAPESVLVYRLRVVHPAEPAEHLAELSGLSTEQITSAQDDLTAIGLLRRSRTGNWVAVAPDSAADQLLTRAELDIARQNVSMAATRAQLYALADCYLEARSMRSETRAVEHVAGLDSIRALIDELARTSTRSLRALVTEGPHTEEAARSALPLDRLLLDRGVAVQYLCTDRHRELPQFREYVTTLAELGGEVNTVADVPARMLIYDDASALMPADPEESARGAILVREPAILRFLTGLFDHLWERSTPLLANESAHIRPPDPTELRVLRGIAAGKTNQALSRELGVSPRTVTRIVAGLMDRLGTDSRFRAGVRAVQLGWLS